MNTNELFSLGGQVAIVTGGAGWIGSHISEALAEAGARVFVADINQDAVSQCVERLQAKKLLVDGWVGDALSDAPARKMVDEIAGKAGRLDVLVNCAAKCKTPEIDNITFDDLQFSFESASAFLVTAQQAVIHMRKTGGGRIINIGSMYGHVTGYPDVYKDLTPPNPLPYQAAKAAVHHMTKYMAVYWAKDNIRVNAISPGPIPNPGKADYAANPVFRTFIERLSQRTPLGRVGKPEEFRGPAVFLASEASSFVTGQILFVDGGWTTW
jgi:NAD(P)-dependent dehydrogenase (short-subunit alcohol dehydrogenase family)